jgi:hypothetical protein
MRGVIADPKISKRVWEGFQTGPEPALGNGLALPQYWKVFEYSSLKKTP